MEAEGRVPILKLGRFLLITIQVELHDALALRLKNRLAAIRDAKARR